MSEFESRVHREIFGRMDPRKMLTLLKTGKVFRCKPGTTLIEEGQSNEHIFLVLEGEALVKVGGNVVCSLGAGRFVGEMTFISELTAASAQVETASDSEIVSFGFKDLHELKKKDPDTFSQFFSVLTIDLVKKVLAPSTHQAYTLGDE